MDINYTEYDDNLNSNEEFDYNKYWEEQPKTEKKKKVSFNDILSNMNLVVGKNGVLQQMRNHVEEPLPQQYIPQQQQYIPQQQQYIPQQQQYIPQQQQYIPQQQQYIPEQQYIPQQPVEPAVKHSYIYNKYFKDYNDNFQPESKVLIPKTIEEYRQMVQEERQKAIEERNRIAQIKSTKLLFTTNQGHNVDNTKPTTIKPSRNSLRSMNFR